MSLAMTIKGKTTEWHNQVPNYPAEQRYQAIGLPHIQAWHGGLEWATLILATPDMATKFPEAVTALAEYKEHLKTFTKYSFKAISNIYKLLDVNKDGQIERSELRDAFVKYSALRQAIGEGPNFK